MMRKLLSRALAAFMILMTFSMVCLPPEQVAAASKRYAKLTAFEGTVTIKKNGGDKGFKAFNGMSLSEGDSIETGVGSSATLEIDKERTVRIADNTKVDLTELKGNVDQMKSNMKLWGGKVYVEIEKKLGNDERFNISTPTAVMGVRGTKFYVGYSPDGGVVVGVRSGSVSAAFYSFAPSTTGEPTLSGFETAVEPGQELTVPAGAAGAGDVTMEEVALEDLPAFVLEAILENPGELTAEELAEIQEVYDAQVEEEQQRIEEQLEIIEQQLQLPPPTIIYTLPPAPTAPTGGGGGGSALSSIVITGANIFDNQTMVAGAQGILEMTVSPSDATVQITSSNSSVVSVASEASASLRLVSLTAVAEGTATITVTAGKSGYETFTRSFTVTVTAAGQGTGTINITSVTPSGTVTTTPTQFIVDVSYSFSGFSSADVKVGFNNETDINTYPHPDANYTYTTTTTSGSHTFTVTTTPKNWAEAGSFKVLAVLYNSTGGDGIATKTVSIPVTGISSNNIVTTKLAHYGITIGNALIPASNPIVAGSTSIKPNVSVETFTGNLNIPAGASYKVANASTIAGAFEDWVFEDIGGKQTYETLETNDLLLIKAEDGTMRGYHITVTPSSSDTAVTTVSDYLNVTVHGSLMTPADNPITAGSVTVKTNMTVSHFMSKLNYPTYSQYKVVSADALGALTGEPIANWPYSDISAKDPADYMAMGDTLLVKAEDGTLRGYSIEVVAASSDTAVSTQSDYFTVTVHGSSMIPADNPIVGNTVSITTSMTVGTFTGKLNYPSGASYIVVNAASAPQTPFESWVFSAITGKQSTDQLQVNDLLLVQAEDGTLRGYHITVNP